ncbi:hypothetical protein [Chishuiella sp.]|uniref:hypothetical protein n=1 Tax=Chishuiella sp. TaxID=1969467 RepID=UPI0028AB8DDC|nr:hypothetical protein [Chishuiella sp.]
MNINKKKIEELIESAETITQHFSKKNEILFDLQKNETKETTKLYELLDEKSIQDPEKSYNLFYQGIQPLLLNAIPQGDIRKVILELKTILLTGKEKKYITYGRRGRDSRMSKSQTMENLSEIISEWSKTPDDYFKLINLFLEKNKSLGYIPEHRTPNEYLPKPR